MIFHKIAKQVFLFLLMNIAVFHGTVSYALPFTIVPVTGSTLPTYINVGQTIKVFYTVTNNTSSTRLKNYVKYLPPGTTQVPSDPVFPNLCGTTFDLKSFESCTLELIVSNPINAKDQNSRHHIMVCFSGGLTCAGTEFLLNVVRSSWKNIGFPSGLFGQVIAAESAGVDVYAGGLNTHFNGQFWRLHNGSWSTVHTLNYADVSNSITVVNNNLLYIGGHNPYRGNGWVAKFVPNTLQWTDTGLTGAKLVRSTAFGNNILYAGGLDTSKNGQVWSYNGSTWTPINIPNLIDLTAMTYSVAQGALFVSGIDTSNDAKVLMYLHGSWEDTHLPSDIFKIYSLVAAPNGVVYAGGFNSNIGAMVMKYQQGRWISTDFPEGQSVNTLVLSRDGVLIAGGIGNNFNGNIWYNRNNEWISTNLGGASQIQELTINTKNILYVIDQDYQNNNHVWSFGNSAVFGKKQ